MNNVVSITSRPRLAPGDVAEIVKARFVENVGKTATIIRRECADDLQGEWFEVRANDESKFVTFNLDTGVRDRRRRRRMLLPADSLRKMWGTGNGEMRR